MANARISEEEARRDIADMIAIFLARKPNLTKVKVDTIKGGEVSYKRYLIKRYDIKSKLKPSDITLPRVCMIFAGISRMIYITCREQILNCPVTESEIGLIYSQKLSYNYIPCLLRPSVLGSRCSRNFTIHNIYQSILTKKTTLRDARNASKYFPNAIKYAMLACTGTLVSAQKITERYIEQHVDGTIKLDNMISDAVGARLLRQLPVSKGR